MERKGYYNELVVLMEGTRDKRDAMTEMLGEEYETKREMEEEMANKIARLRELKMQLKRSNRSKIINARYLADLEAGGLRAELALRRLKYASVPVEERAAELREAFRKSLLLEDDDDLSPHASKLLGSSKENNHMSVAVEDLGFEGDGGIEVPVRCYRGNPSTDVASVPVLVYFHGEGHVLGDLETHDWICRSLAALARVSVVAVGYRRAPEAPFPAAFNDAYGAITWIAGGGLGKVPASICVGGDGSGAGLALACSLKARDDEKAPEIQLQILFYPWTDLRPEAPTMEGDDIPFLADLDWFRTVYAPPHDDEPGDESEDDAELNPPDHPLVDGRPWFEDFRASPILGESFVDLPAAFIAYAEDDPLACESVRLAQRLRSEVGHDGVHTLQLAGPLGHGFAKRRDQPQAHTALSAAAAFASAALRAPMSPGMGKPSSRQRRGKVAHTPDDEEEEEEDADSD